MLPELPSAEIRRLLRDALLVRRFEEGLVGVGPETPGFYHTSIGLECTAVLLASLLRSGDASNSTHRNHAHMLARGVPPSALMAEIFGKVTGTNRGFGGSMHSVSVEHGIAVNSAMVGGTVPPIVGMALARKLRGTDNVAVACFGDGGLTEGAVYEGVCLAALWQVPAVFVCENDRPAEASLQQATGTVPAREVQEIVAGFAILARAVDGGDVGTTHRMLRELIEHARSGGGPVFLEVRTQGWPGKGTDPVVLPGGRSDLALLTGERAVGPDDAWHAARDPLGRFAREALGEGVLSGAELHDIDREVAALVEKAIAFARSSPEPTPEDARELMEVFA